MRTLILIFFFLPIVVQAQAPEIFSTDNIMSYPFTNALTAAKDANRIVWAMNEKGTRNLYVAEGPDFTPRNLTGYKGDEGQDFSSVKISDDGSWIVFIRGGDFGSNWDDALTVNPNFLPDPPKVHIWSIPYEGGQAVSHGKGEHPVISHSGDRIAFVRNKQIWISPIDGS